MFKTIFKFNVVKPDYHLVINRFIQNSFFQKSKLLSSKNLNKNKKFIKKNISLSKKNFFNQFRKLCSSNYPNHIKVSLPALSPTMEVGTIVSWEKKEGDRLFEGDLLAEIETDKATMGFETPEEGYLAKILIQAGEKNIPLGKLLCIIVQNESDIDKFKDYASSNDDTQPNLLKEENIIEESEATQIKTKKKQEIITNIPKIKHEFTETTKRIFCSPLAKQLALAKGIDISLLKGSGPNGRIITKDVENANVTEKISNLFNSSQNINLTKDKQLLAQKLLLSKQTIPHYYLNVEIEIDELLNIKSQMNQMLSKEDIKLSLNDFIIKASALSCKKVPEANSSWHETFIRQYHNVDISITVNTENGLVTPIIFKADEIGIKEINEKVRLLANKAKNGQLQSNEIEGGTFTINNFEMFNINKLFAIINLPQSCTLSVGSIEKRVVLNKDSIDDNDKFKEVNVLTVTLSCDHRVIDGAVGAKWLQHFTQYINNPITMIL